MSMYSTGYLEHHAEVFATNLLHKHGITLDQYLADPARYQNFLSANFPLLPVQTKVRVRLIREEIMQRRVEEIDKELDGLPRNNVRPFLPLRHNRYPKRRGIASCFRRSRNQQPTQPQTT